MKGDLESLALAILVIFSTLTFVNQLPAPLQFDMDVQQLTRRWLEQDRVRPLCTTLPHRTSERKCTYPRTRLHGRRSSSFWTATTMQNSPNVSLNALLSAQLVTADLPCRDMIVYAREFSRSARSDASWLCMHERFDSSASIPGKPLRPFLPV
jgi:hypothetical protein